MTPNMLQFRFYHPFMRYMKQAGKFMNDMVLVLIEPAVCIYDLPDVIDNAILLFIVELLVDNICKMPDINTPFSFLLRYLQQLTYFLIIEVERLFEDLKDTRILLRAVIFIRMRNLKQYYSRRNTDAH